jgi:hypothetical protein
MEQAQFFFRTPPATPERRPAYGAQRRLVEELNEDLTGEETFDPEVAAQFFRPPGGSLLPPHLLPQLPPALLAQPAMPKKATKKRSYKKRSYKRKRSQDPNYAWVRVHRDPKLRATDIAALQRIAPADGVGRHMYSDVNPDMQAARKLLRWRGPGMYLGGRGSYLRKAEKWRQFALDSGKMGRGLIGMGAYETEGSNEIINGGEASTANAPAFLSSQDDLGGIVINHCEYLTDIYGNGTTDPFDIYEWSINPGLERTFPWLSQVAQNFEEWEGLQLLFHFRSTISNDVSSSNGQVGSIIMATNYNASAPTFTDKGQMMQYAGANSGKVTMNLSHGVECDPRQSAIAGSGLYCRASPQKPGEDLKTYDIGVFSLAVSGTPTSFANQPIGELWVEYTFKMRKPKLFTGVGSGISTDIFYGGGTYSFDNWLGTAPLVAQQNNIQTVLAKTGTGKYTITFPANCCSFYEIQVCLYGMAATADCTLAPSITGSLTSAGDIPAAGGQAGSYVPFGTETQAAPIGAAGMMVFYHVKAQASYNGVANTVSFTLTGAGNVSQMGAVGTPIPWIRITEYNTMANPFKPPVILNSAGTVVVP